MSTYAKKPSLILVFYVPPDLREVGLDNSSTLAATKLPDNRMMSVYTGSVNSTPLECLFDTGASKCFMGIRTVRKLGLEMRQSRLKSVATAAGQSTPTLGEVTFRLQLDAAVFEITAHILPSFLENIQLIIGQDWMEQHSVKLSFSRTDARCTIQTVNGSEVVLQNVHGLVRDEPHDMIPGHQKGLVRDEPHDMIPVSSSHTPKQILANQISVKMAARLLKKHYKSAFVALIKPVKVSPPDETAFSVSEKGTFTLPDLSHVSADHREKLQMLLEEFQDIFSESPQAGGAHITDLEHTIDLVPGSKPPFRRNFRFSPLEIAELKKQVAEFLEKGLITPSNSPYGAPVLFIPKPNGGLRFCLDYRGLNEITHKTRYQLPRIDDLLDAARGASFFSALDLAGGYFQLRIAEKDRVKTAFSTPYGHYEWTVLPQGLTNGPASFQRTMTKVFEKYVGDFVLVYMDDLLIISKTVESHLSHLRTVFEKLREFKFQAKLSKCKFLQQQIKYLGHIISKDGIQADPAKVKTLVDWEPPKNATGMLQFLGLANYFRKFIPNFSRLSAPLYHLTKKTTVFSIGDDARLAFEAIKRLLITPPLLTFPNPELPYELVSDASLAGCGAVLTQEGKPIAYFSSKFSPAERNYTTGEQELLGIIKALKEWRCYLEGCNGLTLVTDHNPLTFFSKQPNLSRRQARWSEFLSRFHFDVKYRPGATNPADSLSRLGMENTLAILALTVSEFDSDLLTRLKEATRLDPHFSDEKECRKYEYHDAGYWTYQGRIVVPASMRNEIISEHHSSVIAGHFSWSRTLDMISRQFWWPQLRETVQTYVSQCVSCQQNKPSQNAPFGLLTPLPIPDSRWHTVTMDFIMDLPRTVNGSNAIMVVVDKLTKFVHLIPTVKTVSAEETARLFIANVYQFHGLPKVIITDRDTRFTSMFWKAFCKRLNLDSRYSTAFHPQTDGQTERANRVIEEVLRHFIDGTHKNWEDLLPLVSFAMNNARSSTTGETPFYLNYGAHPATPVSLGMPQSNIPTLDVIFQDMNDTLSRIKSLMKAAQDRQKAYADKKRKPHDFKVEDMVLLSTKNIKFAHGKKKLHPRYIGPFQIDSIIGAHRNAVRLRLPESYRIHPVFHVSLIRPFRSGSTMPTPLVNEPEIVDGIPFYKVETILAKRIRSRGRGRKVTEFLIKWSGYDDTHNSWEPRENITDDLRGTVHDPQNLLD